MARKLSCVLALLLFACDRPVDRPAAGDTFIRDVRVEPEFARADVPLEISFVVNGPPPQTVRYELAGQTRDCVPETVGDRARCVHPGVGREVPQGRTAVVVEAVDEDGAVATAAGELTVDFDCPRFIALSLSQPIAEPGDTVVLNVEASEVLAAPPRVTRLGRDWGSATGGGLTWSLGRTVSDQDPAQLADVVVRMEDRAGNTTADCGADGRLPFAVDHRPPAVDLAGVRLERGPPGQPAFLEADPDSFLDDVGIEAVRVLDDAGVRIADLEVAPDGSISRTSLGAGQLCNTPIQGRLEVDLVAGTLELRPGVTLP